VSDAGPLESPKQRSPLFPCLVIVLVAVAAVAVLTAILAMAAYFFLPHVVVNPQRPDFQQSSAFGRKPPRWALEPLTGAGEPITSEEVTGRVVLINFWGTWCPPCVAELPDIAEIEGRYRGNPEFRLLAVSCGRGVTEDLAQLRAATTALLNEKNVDMPTFADPEQFSRLAFSRLGAFEGFYPTTLILDREGVIRGVWEGRAEKDELENLISQLLGAK
jgi:cytochrome c biogenesis protein CcmG/thiol:disulfide interchange protein DsbE